MRKETLLKNYNTDLNCPCCGNFLTRGSVIIKQLFPCHECGASIVATRTENGQIRLSVWTKKYCQEKAKHDNLRTAE